MQASLLRDGRGLNKKNRQISSGSGDHLALLERTAFCFTSGCHTIDRRYFQLQNSTFIENHKQKLN